MALKKAVHTTRDAHPATDARYEYFLSDDAAEHPRCLCARVHVSGEDVVELYLQHVTRDGDGKVTGRIPAAPFTGPQLVAVRNACGAVFAVAAAKAGYVDTP